MAPRWTGTSRSRLLSSRRSTTQRISRPQEYTLPLVPRQQPIHQPSPTPDDLARHPDDRVHEPLELHPQQAALLRPVRLLVPGMLRDRQREPGLQVPRQRRHHHERPVAHQVVHRRPQRVDPALQLRDQVLLVAPVVGLEHQLACGGLAVVGQVEPIADLVEQPRLALLHRDRLADHDQAVRPLAGRRPIVDLGHVLPDPGQRLEPALADDPVLDLLGTRSRLPLGRVLRRPSQFGPVRRGQVLGDRLEVGHRVDAEEERHALGVPGVELLGLGEVGVAPEIDAAEAGLAAEEDGQVELLGGPLMRGPVAGAVDDADHLAGVGQRDDQRVIAPGPVVGDVDALLAAGAGGDQRAVDVDDGLVEEVGRLLLARP